MQQNHWPPPEAESARPPTQDRTHETQPAPQPSERSWWRETCETILPAILIVVLINLFLAQPRVVHGESMEPNLHESQRVIVDLVTYRIRAPQAGEIIILNVPERDSGPPLIKRVIGLPGDTVEISNGQVHVNGEILDEPYLDQITAGHLPRTIVPEEHVFVLGDNRGCSNDSRYFGTVPYEYILGRAYLSYWPLSEMHVFH